MLIHYGHLENVSIQKNLETKLEKYLLGKYYPRRCYCKKINIRLKNKTVKIIPRNQGSLR